MHQECQHKMAQLSEADVNMKQMQEVQHRLRHDISTNESSVSELRLTVSLLEQQLGMLLIS
jgi:septation ring formation regulator EzrA